MSEQRQNIERVSTAISNLVVAFLRSHIGKEFHVESLRQYVFSNVQGYVAPASPDRILRDLRQKGVIDYRVVNRRQSLYMALPVNEQGKLF
jgi:ribosomal protein S25